MHGCVRAEFGDIDKTSYNHDDSPQLLLIPGIM